MLKKLTIFLVVLLVACMPLAGCQEETQTSESVETSNNDNSFYGLEPIVGVHREPGNVCI